MLVKLDHFPNFLGENTKYLRCHHPVTGDSWPFEGDAFKKTILIVAGKMSGFFTLGCQVLTNSLELNELNEL